LSNHSGSSSGSRKNGKEGDESPDDAPIRKKDLIKSMRQKESDVLSELAQRYRDRAKERRDGANPDYVINEDVPVASGGANVAPDHKSGTDFAERRKQMIEQSKFLGGDMAHTHLVRGLDYALLHKVKAELHHSQLLGEEENEEEDNNGDESGDVIEDGHTEIDRRPDVVADGSDEFDIRSRMALSIVSLLNQKVQPVTRNELFLPSRMAYLVDLGKETGKEDIPITVIRSKSECPSLDALSSHSTTDIVINKLAVIIASHRAGVIRKEGDPLCKGQNQSKKMKYESTDNSLTAGESGRKIAGKTSSSSGSGSHSQASSKSDAGLSIYDDLDDEDYVPVRCKKKSST
jgi:IK cytokine